MQYSQQVQTSIVTVVAFVDWNTQLLLTRRNIDVDPKAASDAALKQTARRLARCLCGVDNALRFRVRMRLYHGWHKGFEPTTNRRAAILTLAQADFSTLSQRSNVVFSPDVEFGDTLAHAKEERLHARLRCHLPNTVRSRYGTGFEEKMVDTALATDVVSTAHTDKDSWLIVVTEDDDMVPPIYAAEFARSKGGTRVLLLRKNPRNTMLNLDGILIND